MYYVIGILLPAIIGGFCGYFFGLAGLLISLPVSAFMGWIAGTLQHESWYDC